MSGRQRPHRILPKARQDLEDIFQYTFEQWSLQQANDYYYNHIIACFPDLANGLRQGREINHIKSGYFVLPFQSHFIVYQSNARTLTIIRILHRRMNIAAHL